MELTTLEGEIFQTYLVGPEEATKAILIIHDWWGLSDYNRDWANQFANVGYRVMVIDLYNGHNPVAIKEAGEYMRNRDQKKNNGKIRAALTALQAPNRKIAVLGWSFGGVQTQHAVLQNPTIIDAIVFFYCRIILDKHNIKTINCPILAIFSETERTWPDKQVSLEHLTSEAHKILVCHSYDADHGFVYPESPRYDNDATEDARKVTIAFLDKYLA